LDWKPASKEKELRKAVALKPGQVAAKEALDGSVAALVKLARSRGLLKSEVKPLTR